MKKLILSSSVVLFSTLTFAKVELAPFKPTKNNLISDNWEHGISSQVNFDGRDFGKPDADVKAQLAKVFAGNIDVSKEKRFIKISGEAGQYKMTWDRQDFENGLDLRMNQATYGKKENSLSLTSVTLNGDYLRSKTSCRGNVSKDSSIYCATATKRVCANVLKAYRQNDVLAAVDKKTIGGTTAVVKDCTNILQNYGKVLEAFANDYNSNSGVAANREQILKQETATIKKMLSDMPGSPEVKHLSASTVRDAAAVLTASMSGLDQINSFVDLCRDNENNFAPDAGSGTAEKPAQR